jgi:hypothetical protein
VYRAPVDLAIWMRKGEREPMKRMKVVKMKAARSNVICLRACQRSDAVAIARAMY